MGKFKFVFILVILAILIVPVSKYLTAENVDITITDKESINTKEKHKYLIYTTDEVFENTDSFLFLKWNSSDIQNKLIKDKTYTVKVAGWRIPFLSSYRNIISIKQETKE